MAHIRNRKHGIGVVMMIRRTPERDRKYLESNDNSWPAMISRCLRIAIAAAR
jgi:hypothetical protein